ncbi:hypothetical protein Syun_005933 [Stephania yunnanensis]|uniref:Uncharacterized protein n=1 Tax=Stephania yunnanensis TaxID=152371 RepID=A0AAP0PX31_9MAGN
MAFLDGDCKSLLARMKFEEKQLNLKRRWLMGLPTSKSKKKCTRTPKFLQNTYLPESLLRKDEVSYEIVRNNVERGFCSSSNHKGKWIVQDYLHLVDMNKSLSSLMETLPSMLDDMNNIGLCRLADTIAAGSDFERTRPKMKQTIKEFLPKILSDKDHNLHMHLREQLPQLLTDPSNFQKDRVRLQVVSHRSAAMKLLEGLENMPFQTLVAMHRKLRGSPNQVPELKTVKSGWNRDRLAKQLRTTCEKMLSEIKEGDELHKPLAKAMTVAALSLKADFENHTYIPQFDSFSQETEFLQNEILKCVKLLKKMNSKNSAVEELRCLLDPNAKVSPGHFRPAVRKMLVEYLFDCSEMQVVPERLLEMLAIIKRNAKSDAAICFSKEDVEEEVESVLIVSCQIKQIACDLLQDLDIDRDFCKAYMEVLQENESDDYISDLNDLHTGGSCTDDDLESIGESRPVTASISENEFSTPLKNVHMNSNAVEVPLSFSVSPPNVKGLGGCGLPSSFSHSCDESGFPYVVQNLSKNPYLAIQEISDETSLVAHKLIGHLMESFLQIKGIDLERSERAYLRGRFSDSEDEQVAKGTQTSSQEDSSGSVLVRAVEELLPSFPKSDIEMVKRLMDLK